MKQTERRFNNLSRRFIKKTNNKNLLASGTFQVNIIDLMSKGYTNDQILKYMINEHREMSTLEFKLSFISFLDNLNNLTNEEKEGKQK